MTTLRPSDPLAADGLVTTDPATRTLYVMPADPRSYAGRLWSKGHRALTEAGYTVRDVWASAPGLGHQTVRGQPVEGGAVRFRFPPGETAYADLVSTPGLSAYVVVDRETGHILGVRFRGRRS